MTTIVSAFISNMNKDKNRNFDYYLELGKLLLKTNIPKIIYVDEIMYEKIKDYNNENTLIVLYDMKSSYLYKYINDEFLSNFNLNSTNLEKDTKEYMFTMCNKTEWVKEAIEINHFHSDNFMWIDFGIRHVFRCDDSFTKYIENLNNKQYNKIRIASIWNPEVNININIYKDIAWYFAGGVFGGNSESLILFSEKMREQCLKIITERKEIMWEVNIWYLIYKDNKHLFDFYQSDHNEIIVSNY